MISANITTDAPDLGAAMNAWQTDIGRSQNSAFRKAARLIGLGLHEGTRAQPPRPFKGSITNTARANKFELNPSSSSMKTGRLAAMNTLRGAKSGYFIVENVNGLEIARPVMVGKRGNILSTSKRGRRRGELLSRPEDQLTRGGIVPPGAVRLNLQALTTLRALGLREKAGVGGYMAAEWLTYKFIKSGTGSEVDSVRAKNNATIGQVSINADSEGNAQSITITGRVPHARDITERHGILRLAFSAAAKTYWTDIGERLRRTFDKALIAGRNP